MKQYQKALVAIGGLCAAVGIVLANGSVDAAEWGFLAGAVGTAIGVFYAKNAPA